MENIIRQARMNIDKLLEEEPVKMTKGFMGNNKPKQVKESPTNTVAHFTRILRNKRKELSDANN